MSLGEKTFKSAPKVPQIIQYDILAHTTHTYMPIFIYLPQTYESMCSMDALLIKLLHSKILSKNFDILRVQEDIKSITHYFFPQQQQTKKKLLKVCNSLQQIEL